jgi:hypothetical protein
MANHYSHAALPFPVRNARFTIQVPYLDADGDPTDPTTPDTEISKDGGSFADCTEEVSTISGSNGMGYITLTSTEMDASMVSIAAKVASGPKATLAMLSPRILPILHNGTAQAGANTSITLASTAPAYDLIGCIVRTTGGTGGGSGGNQARVITAYDTSTKVATVSPAWETNPSSDTTYDILLTDMASNSPVTRALRPATDGRTLNVASTGEAEADAVKVSGDSTAADNLEAACDGTGYNVGGGSVVAASVTGNVGGNISGTVPNSAGVTTLLGLVTEARMGALTDWINGGRLDLILDAIAGDVVNLDGAAMRGTDGAALASAWTATRAGYVDLLNTYLDAAISSRLASSGYTAPDNASITSILEDTGTTIPAQISGLNNLSSAQAQSAAAAALTAYDPPTKAELDSAVSPLATSVALATVDGNVDSILTDTGTTIPAQINGLNNLSSAQAQSAATAALTAYDPPTKAEMDAGHALLATAASIAALNNISTAQVLAQATAALEATITEPDDLTNLSAKGILYHLFSRFFHRNTQTATAQVTYKANGTTALATRTASDDGTTQELGKAT